MRSMKMVFGLVGALLPVLYFGGLFFYFRGFEGWSDGPMATGLGPTMLGLGALGLLFCIPLVLKLIRLATRAGGPAPAAPGGPDPEPESSFDADAALARYLARKAAAGGEIPEPAPAVAPRATFGRKLS
jgi:hypothetical protein